MNIVHICKRCKRAKATKTRILDSDREYQVCDLWDELEQDRVDLLELAEKAGFDFNNTGMKWRT